MGSFPLTGKERHRCRPSLLQTAEKTGLSCSLLRSAVWTAVHPRAALTSESITPATKDAASGNGAGSAQASSPSAPPFVIPAEASAPPDTYQKVRSLLCVCTAPRLAN